MQTLIVAAESESYGAAKVHDAFGSLLTDITSNYIPAFLTPVLLSSGFVMGIRWLNRASRSQGMIDYYGGGLNPYDDVDDQEYGD